MNAKDELLKLAEGEVIEAIFIGSKGYCYSDDEFKPEFFGADKVEEALKRLDFEFYDGFGGEEGHRIFAWTKSWVMFKSVYDGAEIYHKIPRNPSQDIVPDGYGG